VSNRRKKDNQDALIVMKKKKKVFNVNIVMILAIVIGAMMYMVPVWNVIINFLGTFLTESINAAFSAPS